MICEKSGPSYPRLFAKSAARNWFLALAADRTGQRLIEGSFGGSVILVINLTLLVLHFKLEELFLERVEKGGRAAACRRRVRNTRASHSPDGAGDKYNSESEEGDYAVGKHHALTRQRRLLQRIGGLDWLAQAAARAIICRRRIRFSAGLVGRVLRLVLQHSLAGNFEGEFLPGLGIDGDFRDCVGQVGRLLVFVNSGLRRGESYASRHHGDKMLQRINEPWINGGLAGIGQVIGDLEFGFAGSQWEGESVSSFFRLRCRRSFDSLSSSGLRLGVIDVGIWWRVKFEIGIVHLRARRIGSVVHGENSGNAELP